MKYFFLFFFLMGTVLAREGAARAVEIENGKDIQLWLRQAFYIPCSPHIGWELTGELRYGDQASKLFYTYGQAIYQIHLFKWLLIGPGYRQIYTLDTLERKWRWVFDPLLDVEVFKAAGKWDFTLRSRTQYFFIETEPNHWLERVRIEAFFPFKLGKLRPYLSNEFFFHQRMGFNENRLIMGFVFPTFPSLHADFSLMIRHLLVDRHWRHRPVLADRHWRHHPAIVLYFLYDF